MGVRLNRARWTAAAAMALAWLAAVPAPGAGQAVAAPPNPDAQLVDRSVAIVGDTIITLSDLRQQVFRTQAQGAQVPREGTPEFDLFVNQILQAMVDELLFIQAAKREGVQASDADVAAQADQLFAERRRQFSSDEEFQRLVTESGMNMLQFRQQLEALARSQIMAGRFRAQLQRDGRLPLVTVSEDEVREVFEQEFSGRSRPAEIAFNQLTVIAIPSVAARDSALERIRQASEELDQGEDFEIVARRYSDDPGTREDGGELGWMQRGQLVTAFADVAWRTRIGSVAGPVQTRFGLHLIRVEDVRGSERLLRHILVRPEIGDEQRDLARENAENIADSLRAGVDPERLQQNPSVLQDPIRLDRVPTARLGEMFPSDMATALTESAPGDVLGPFLLDGPIPQFAVAQVITNRSAGSYTLADVSDRVRDQIRFNKQLEALVQRLREETYVQLRL